jgi:hypothetical protein
MARGLFDALTEDPMDTTTTTAPAAPAGASAASGYGWPPKRCPAHRRVLSGGPVAYHCPAGRLGHQVMAADIEEAAEQAAPAGAAA